MPLALFRIDERLLHGQVIAGWGMQLGLAYFVIVDDELAQSRWEQDLYMAGLPGGVEAAFVGVEEAKRRFEELDALPGRGALLTRGTGQMRELASAGLLRDRTVNVGGLHAGEGRRRALGYVYLRPADVEDLRAMACMVRRISARDLPMSREVGLEELIDAAE